MTVDEYLAWSETQSELKRTELINGQVVVMAAERVAHNRIKIAALIALREAVAAAGCPCEVLTEGVSVKIDDHTAYEPDALVHCGERLPGATMLASHPVIIVEVLSPTTRHSDTSAKLIGYFKLPSPSVAHYLAIDPETRAITHHKRSGVPNILTEGPLRLDPPGLDLTVEDLLGPA